MEEAMSSRKVESDHERQARQLLRLAELDAENQRLTTERDGAEKAGRAESERFLAQLDDLRIENQRLREEVAFLRERQIKLLALAGDGE
jgi:predicted  nucleic acid-binding Zn-ribbon protein